jgi:chemotaxis methyl-accepting protein methylase
MMGDDDFRRLLDHLDRPWAGFRKVRKGVKKRLRRHMTRLGCDSIQDYLGRIDGDAVARAGCEDCLAVTISRFLRDRGLWQGLQDRILPGLAERFGDPLSAWSAGCAGGEEPYSLAMVALAAADNRPAAASIRILATDARPPCLERAVEGRYPASSLREVPESWRDRFFRPAGRRAWRVDPGLGEGIRWQVHDLLAVPPEGSFHLVFLRNNLLTYYRGRRLETAFHGIVGRIPEGGVLVVGSHERPPAHPRLGRDPACPWVYRVQGPAGGGAGP